jgi:phage-related protein
MSIDYIWPTSLPGPADDNYQWQEAPRIRTAKFGDGYEQRTADGLNTRPRTLTLDWPNLGLSDKDTLLNFLRARNGIQAFWWLPPGETQTLKIKAPSWSVSRTSGPYWSVSVNFEEVFDPAISPTMSLNFKTQTYLMGSSSFTSLAQMQGYVFSRNGIQGSVNASGVVSFAAANVPAIDTAGAHIYAATTNLVFPSSIGSGLTDPAGGTAAASTAGVQNANFTAAATAQTHTAMIVVAPDAGDWMYLSVDDTPAAGSAQVTAWFNVRTGVLGSTSIAGTGLTLVGTPRMTPLANGFYRCAFQFASATATALRLQIRPVAADLGSSNSGSVICYHRQVLDLSFPAGGPLIVTTGGTLNLPKSSLELGASLLSGDFIAWATLNTDDLPTATIIPFAFSVAGGGSATERLYCQISAAGQLSMICNAGGVSQPAGVLISGAVVAGGGRITVMLRRKNGIYSVACKKASGVVTIGADAAGVGLVPAISAVDIGQLYNGANQINGRAESFTQSIGTYNDAQITAILQAA